MENFLEDGVKSYERKKKKVEFVLVEWQYVTYQ